MGVPSVSSVALATIPPLLDSGCGGSAIEEERRKTKRMKKEFENFRVLKFLREKERR